MTDMDQNKPEKRNFVENGDGADSREKCVF